MKASGKILIAFGALSLALLAIALAVIAWV
jgi:hypothetical protein